MAWRSVWRRLVMCLAAACAAMACASPAVAQFMHAGTGFSFIEKMPEQEQEKEPWIRASRYQGLVFDRATVEAILKNAPMEFTPAGLNNPLVFFLPTPEGVYQRFSVVEAPIMEPGLAAQFPDIKTFRGQGIDDPWATLRMDYTPQGFHAQVLTPSGEGAWYIDPFSAGDTVVHSAYYRKHLRRTMPWTCGVVSQNLGLRGGDGAGGGTGERSSGTQLRTVRLAVAATAEYTTFHGGTVALGQAAIVTAINRVTGVYEVETAVRMVLVANNNLLVYTDSASDPYTNGNGSTMLGQNQTNIDAVIGNANYDIGHVFSTGGGGIAGLGVVCSTGNKARGVTGQGSPTGDPFWIDYVAHEMGHQFDGDHTFNGNTGSCSGNRTSASAYEPGSGSTIQAYAGICGADNLQSNSDAYFHTQSYNQIRAYMEAAASCGTNTATGNTIPTVNAGPDYVIPIGTPFTLTATGSDANGDAITFCWEERSLGAAQTLAALDNGASPLTRSRAPTTSPSRTIPRLSTILANTNDPAEELPALGRAAWNWRCTVRDNRSGGGGVNEDDVVLTVAGTAGPFVVTNPNAAGTFAGLVEVTWNVANTNASPVNCANVKISLSTDGGNTFPTVLASTTPNDGSEFVTLPNITTSAARIKIEAVGNIFFDISNANFSITPVASGVVFASGGAPTVADSAGNGNNNGVAEPGESAVVLTVPIRNNGATTATSVTGTLTSLTATASVVTGVSAYADLAFNATANNATPLVIAISPAHPCGTPVNLRMSMTSTQGSGTIDFSIPIGTTAVGSAQTFSWTGALAIPDNDTAGVSATVPVSGFVGTISDINFRFDGTSCSSGSTNTNVGLQHTWVGDLVVTLTSPQGTSVTILNRPGGVNNNGNNFCQTVLDSAASASIATGGAPWTGTYLPANALNAFNGQNPNGTWTLSVADVVNPDSGTLRRFSLIITSPTTVTCEPPAPADGACCLNTGACTVVSGSAACAGDYRGDGSTCPPSPACAQPTTCCLTDGSCVVIPVGGTCSGSPRADSTCPPATACAQPFACCASDGSCTVVPAGGTCNGTVPGGSVCPPSPDCPQPTACCLSDGSCTVIPVGGTCNGTVPGGAVCPPTSACPQPFACCAADGTCSIVLPPAICNGTAAAGSVCPPSPACAQPTTCCLADGSCTVVLVGGTCNGTPRSDSACPPTIPCPPPTGACCAASGLCSILSAADCNAVPGAYQGDSTSCEPTNPCPQPSGACCGADGSCSVTTQASCAAGVWTSGGSCDPNVCPQPQGVCCASDGACSVGTQAQCSGGVWSTGGSCDPNPCPQPQGRCCAASGACSVTVQSACSGTWTGGTTVCDPNPCPQPPQTCCRGTTCLSVPAGTCGATVSGGSPFVVTSCTISNGPPGTTCCFADFDHGGVTDINDIFTYLNAWFSASPYAKFAGDGVLTPDINDIFQFLNAWFAGCGT